MMIEIYCKHCKKITTYNEDLTYLWELKVNVDPAVTIFRCIGCDHRIGVDSRVLMLEGIKGNLTPFIDTKHVIEIENHSGQE